MENTAYYCYKCGQFVSALSVDYKDECKICFNKTEIREYDKNYNLKEKR